MHLPDISPTNHPHLTRRPLSRHPRPGAWRCQWCECKYEDANGKGPGPSGAQTLCSACANRWRSGHTGPPQRNEDGKFMCEGCSKTFDTIMGLGR